MRVIAECEDQIASARKANPLTFCLMGWCYFSIDEYGMATRFYSRARSEGLISLPVEMDFGLVLLARGQDGAFDLYRTALKAASEQSVLRKAGLIRVALHDIRELVFRRPEVSATSALFDIRELLSRELLKTLQQFDGKWSPYAARLQAILPLLVPARTSASAELAAY